MSLKRWIISRGVQSYTSWSKVNNTSVFHQQARRCVSDHYAVRQQRTYRPEAFLIGTSASSQRTLCSRTVEGLPESLRPQSPAVCSAKDTTNGAQEYSCPSRILERFSQLVILDQAVPSHSFYDLPVSRGIVLPIIAPNPRVEEITEPPSSQTDNSTGKFAKEIMRIRHKKMKKKKLRKLRKRMYYVWKKMRLVKEKKKNIIYQKELDEIKVTGSDFDAKAFVNDQLKRAKRGGYYINIFESKI